MNWQLATYAVSGNNRYLLNLMLERINSYLINKWILHEHETADAILVDIDKPEGRQFWQNYPDSRILVAFSWRNVYQTRWFLEKPLSQIQPLVELFQQLSAEKWQQMWLSPASFEPCWYFLGLLQGSLYLNQPRRFNCGHLPPIYVLPTEKRCFTAVFNPNQLTLVQQACLSAQSKDIDYVDLSVAELKAQVQATRLKTYRIEIFLWLSALQASHGRLINGYSTRIPVRLNRWPNSVELPYQEDFMVLAAFMLHNTSDLITIAAKTKVPLTTVINFFNGCIVLDLVTVYDKMKPVIRKPLLKPPQNCLHRMFNRLLA
ncbi:MAG: hypothetical protein HC877_16795 [Thioploca sp.]|nr:hypothetical protein [Thioploca sp.]